MTTPSFGSELRRRRTEKRLSLDAFARHAHVTKGYLSKIENGKKVPSEDMARALDVALGANGGLLELRSVPPARVDLPVAKGVPAIGWTLTLAPDGGGGFVPVVAADGTPEADIAMLAQRLSAHGAKAAARSDHALRLYRGQFDGVRGVSRVVSPSLVLPMLVTQLNGVRGIARHAGAELRAPLLRLAARYADLAGWMTEETGDLKAAAWWTAHAIGDAREAGDAQLEMFLLHRQGEIAYNANDLRTTLELTRRVQTAPGATPRVRALAAQREAHALARLLDAHGTMAALERSRMLFAQAEAEADTEAGPSTEPTLGGTSTADPAAMAVAWCLYDLRRSRQAADLFDRHVDAIPEASLRARTLFRMRRAASYAAAGEIDHACDLALSLLGDVELVDSAGVRAEIGSLCAELRNHHTHPRAQTTYVRLLETSGNA